MPQNSSSLALSKSSVNSVLLLVAIRVLLDLAYVYYVAPTFGYAGFKLVPDVPQYFVSWVLYLAVLPLTPTVLRKVSDAVFMFATTSIIAPLTSMFGLSGESIVPVLMAILSMAFLFAIVNIQLFRIVRFPYFRSGQRFAVLASLAFVLVVVLHYLVSGVHLNLDLTKVYDFRSGNSEKAGSGIFAYLNPWAFQVFNLFLMAVCLMRKRYAAVVLLLVVQVVLFAASQQKSVLFAPLVVIGVWWYFRKSNSLLIIPASLLALQGILLVAYFAFSSVLLPSLAIRRIFFVPAQLDFVYYSFFWDHTKVLWSDSFWMPLFPKRYPVAIPYVIGGYLGIPSMSANNGYISSGFAQAGFLGVFLYTLILGVTLKFVDNESGRLGAVWLGVALFLLPFMTIWRSSDLTTSMLTHGFLVMLVLLGLLRRPPDCSIAFDTDISNSQPERVDIGGRGSALGA